MYELVLHSGSSANSILPRGLMLLLFRAYEMSENYCSRRPMDRQPGALRVGALSDTDAKPNPLIWGIYLTRKNGATRQTLSPSPIIISPPAFNMSSPSFTEEKSPRGAKDESSYEEGPSPTSTEPMSAGVERIKLVSQSLTPALRTLVFVGIFLIAYTWVRHDSAYPDLTCSDKRGW